MSQEEKSLEDQLNEITGEVNGGDDTTTSSSITSVASSAFEKKKSRAERFGTTVEMTEEEKAEARKNRFTDPV